MSTSTSKLLLKASQNSPKRFVPRTFDLGVSLAYKIKVHASQSLVFITTSTQLNRQHMVELEYQRDERARKTHKSVHACKKYRLIYAARLASCI